MRPRSGAEPRIADGVASTTHSSGGFARRAATVAFGVNPPEQRPSVSAATAEGRRAQPSSTAMMARARRPWVAEMSGAFGSACLRRVRHLPVGLRKQFGQRLLSIRQQRRLTQEQFAELVGISVDFLSLIERGVNAPSFETLELLAKGLDMPVAHLFMFGEARVRRRIRRLAG